jgi:hypothetical protein
MLRIHRNQAHYCRAHYFDVHVENQLPDVTAEASCETIGPKAICTFAYCLERNGNTSEEKESCKIACVPRILCLLAVCYAILQCNMARLRPIIGSNGPLPLYCDPFSIVRWYATFGSSYIPSHPAPANARHAMRSTELLCCSQRLHVESDMIKGCFAQRKRRRSIALDHACHSDSCTEDGALGCQI